MMRPWISLPPAIGALLLVCTVAAATPPPTPDECAGADETAQTLRRAGKIRAAKEKLLVCINASCPSVVKSDCTDRLSEVQKAVPTLVFAAKDADGNDLSAVTVTMDGAPLVDHLDGTAVPVDPGKHRFVFTAGAHSSTKELVIGEGEKDRREGILIGSSSASRATTSMPEATEGDAGSRSVWPTYVAFGVGATGLVVGSIFGVMALSTKSTLDSECPSKTGCPQGDIDTLSARGWVSNIGFAVGIVGAGVGIVLFATSGGSDQPSVSAYIGPGAIRFVGTLP
jgi:hypothetical protein